MARVVNVSGQKVRDAQSTRFKALEAGEYTVSLYDVKEEKYGPNSNNAGRPYYNVQLRIEDGQPGANRRLFEKIPLFLEWNPTPKNPEGSDAFTFYDFFAAVEGIKSSEFRARMKKLVEAEKDLEVPDPTPLMGKKVNVVLDIVNDSFAYEKAVAEGTLEEGETEEDYTRNRVRTWKPAAKVKQESSQEDRGFEL